jgi:hypothetical protein
MTSQKKLTVRVDQAKIGKTSIWRKMIAEWNPVKRAAWEIALDSWPGIPDTRRNCDD